MLSHTDVVRHAMDLAEAGNVQEARAALVDLLKDDPDNIEVWAALAQLAETPKDTAYCLKQIVRIQPDNEWARDTLRQLSWGSVLSGQEHQHKIPDHRQQTFSRPGKFVSGKSGIMTIAGIAGILLILVIAVWGRLSPGTVLPMSIEPELSSQTPLPGMPLTPSATFLATIDLLIPFPTGTDVDARHIMSPVVTDGLTATMPTVTQTLTLTLASSPTLTQTSEQPPTDYPTPTDPPMPQDVPTDVPIPGAGPCDCYGDRLTCKDFTTQAAAQACYDHCLAETGIDIFSLDKDRNNIVCEDLP
ncbi:MAG: hypothetical protein JXB07_13480 [Anaerolineae bacterium]|nr:hypothetical protein [Anaerolineae bacterium]